MYSREHDDSQMPLLIEAADFTSTYCILSFMLTLISSFIMWFRGGVDSGIGRDYKIWFHVS